LYALLVECEVVMVEGGGVVLLVVTIGLVEGNVVAGLLVLGGTGVEVVELTWFDVVSSVVEWWQPDPPDRHSFGAVDGVLFEKKGSVVILSGVLYWPPRVRRRLSNSSGERGTSANAIPGNARRTNWLNRMLAGGNDWQL